MTCLLDLPIAAAVVASEAPPTSALSNPQPPPRIQWLDMQAPLPPRVPVPSAAALPRPPKASKATKAKATKANATKVAKSAKNAKAVKFAKPDDDSDDDMDGACDVAVMRLMKKAKKEHIAALCSDFGVSASGTKRELAEDLAEQLHYETDDDEE